MQQITNEYLIYIIKFIISISIISLIIIIPIVIIFLLIKTKKHNYIDIIHINKEYIKLQKLIQIKLLQKNEFKKLQKLQSKNKNIKITKNMFVIKFNGDIYASDIIKLKNIISIIILTAKTDDEVLLILNSNGGLVNCYGLAASQLERLKIKNIKLTISIDLIAASGGYLMACLANSIIASQFAIIGSIGVIGQMPNFHRLLNKNLIDIESHTAGEFKRTLTIFGKNTDKGREKFCESLNKTHQLFKDFVKKHRPQLYIDKIATGEYWYGEEAIKLQLIDKIQTSDDFIIDHLPSHNIYEIKIKKQKKFNNILLKNIKSYICNNIIK